MGPAGKSALIAGATHSIRLAVKWANVTSDMWISNANKNLSRASKTARENGILVKGAKAFPFAPNEVILRTTVQCACDLNFTSRLSDPKPPSTHLGPRITNVGSADLALQAAQNGNRPGTEQCPGKLAAVSPTRSDPKKLVEFKVNLNAIAPSLADDRRSGAVDAFIAKYKGKTPGQRKKLVSGIVSLVCNVATKSLTSLAAFPVSEDTKCIAPRTCRSGIGIWMS